MKRTWLATVLCLFLGPLGLFYFGWRPAVAGLLLFGSVSMIFHAWANAETATMPPWVLPSVIFVWAYVGWRHARGWNAESPCRKANYFGSFTSGVLSTLYLVWLNVLISLPVLGMFAFVDEDMNLQLRAGAMSASLLLLVAFVWFWAGRSLFFPWCERAFGRLRSQQVNHHKMSDEIRQDALAGLCQIYRACSQMYLSSGYSPEEAFWMQFAEISVSTKWDKNATREVNLSDVLWLYLTIYRKDVRPEMPVQDDALFLKVLREGFDLAESAISDSRLDINQKMLSLGRFVLPGNPSVVRQTEAAMIVMKAINAYHARIPFKLVRDV